MLSKNGIKTGIKAFIDAKDDEGSKRTGNVSIKLTDAFMQAVYGKAVCTWLYPTLPNLHSPAKSTLVIVEENRSANA